jgi:glycosyltransferase involved in cell wall biosynthesis
MRIIVLISSLYTGGAEFSTLNFYGWLKKHGFDVRLICYKDSNPKYDPEMFGFSDHIALKPGSFHKKFRQLRQIIKQFNPDLVHSVLFEANVLGRFCRITNPSFVHLESLVNEMYSSNRYHDPRVKWYKLKAYQFFDFATQLFGVDHFHANGISVARHYEKKLLVSKKRITIIPRGRGINPYINDRSVREEVRNKLRIPPNALVFIQVARHEYQKAQEIFIRAFARVNNRENLFFVVVGREGNLTSIIKAEIDKHQLTNNIILTGHRNDIAQLLVAADIFVFPSRFEGLPGALIEAEAAGLPIICSDISNNREVASENENAIFFKVNDVDGLSNKLSAMIADRKQLVRMGEKSLAIFKKNFELEDIHQRMKTLVETLVQAK